MTGGWMSPLRSAWLAYQKAEFAKEWSGDKERAEAMAAAAWCEWEKQLLKFCERKGVTPVAEYDI